MNGNAMFSLARELFPLCRSITGEGTRETLRLLAKHLPLEIREVTSGTHVLDWQVPDEWNVREAWIKNSAGQKVVDFAASNLHLVQYSEPFHGHLSLAELDKHLHSLPDQPSAIPYRTSYYDRTWGFCLRHAVRDALTEDRYEVMIDATLAPGLLTYGELFLPGESEEEILISTHICHPSMANDNLSGMLTAVSAAALLRTIPHRHSVRFIFIPGTIGSITWLACNLETLPRIRHGLVLAGLGSRTPFHYKKSRAGDAIIDRVVGEVLQCSGKKFTLLDFSPYGYDERQFNSPGILLPTGCFSRAPHGTYREYHTSLDNLAFISPDSLGEASELVLQIISVLDRNRTYVNMLPYGEPQLGRRGLYASTPGENLAILWVLNLSDGTHCLLDIAQRSKLPFADIATAAERLFHASVLQPLATDS